jgi:hypothetical protein
MSGKPGNGRPRLAFTCNVNNCARKGKITRGMCAMHYSRWQRHGSTESLTNMKRHGYHGIPEYDVWCTMKARCSNPNTEAYHRYGGRGITVCNEWKDSFEQFFKDMGPRPEKTSIERINTNGNYEPSNCRWATAKEQAWNRNKRQNSKNLYIGVNKHHNKYSAYIKIDGKSVYLGAYHDAIEAAIAYDTAAIFFRGSSAVTNFL